jgi:hypothetical protein
MGGLNMLKSIKFYLAVATVIIVILGGSVNVSAVDLPEMNPTMGDIFELTEPEKLTDVPDRSIYPNILIDSDDNMHLIWSDSRFDPDPNDHKFFHDIFYKKFDSEGNVLVGATQTTFATDHYYLPYGFYSPGPVAALDSDGNIHLAYHDAIKDQNPPYWNNVEIYYMKFNGHLDTGGAPAVRSDLVMVDEQRVSEGTAHSGDPDIVIDSEDNVHIVWYDHRSTNFNWEIYYEKLSVDGTVLIDEMRLTFYLGYGAGPDIAVDSNDDLHIAFKVYDWWTYTNSIYYIKMDNDGNTLVPIKLVTTEGNPTPYQWYKVYPLILVDDDDNVQMVWYDERASTNYEIHYLKLSGVGDPLMPAPQRLTYNSGQSYMQDFKLNDGIMYIMGRDNTPGQYQQFIILMDTDGNVVLDHYQLTFSDSTSDSPSMAFDSAGRMHMAWMDTLNFIPDIYHLTLVPHIVELGFLVEGVGSGTIELTIYEDDTVIDTLTIVRGSGNPADNIVTTTMLVDLGKSYRVECDYTGPSAKKNGNGAVPLKLYLMEDGELGEKLANTMVNANNGKNAKDNACFDLDAIFAELF